MAEAKLTKTVEGVVQTRGAATTAKGLVSGLPVLQCGSNNNFFKFEELIHVYALKEYGDIGRIFKDKEYPEINNPAPPAALRNVAEKNYTIELEGLKAAYIKECQEAASARSEMKNAKTKLYGTIMGQLSADSLLRIKEETAWSAVQASCDPLELWKLVTKTHLVSTSGVKSEDRMTVRREYQGVVQLPDEALGDFITRFNNAHKQLVEPMPEEDLAADFIDKLDDVRYASMKTNIRHNALQKIKAYPKSMKEAILTAQGWRVPERDVPEKAAQETTGVPTAAEIFAAISKNEMLKESLERARRLRAERLEAKGGDRNNKSTPLRDKKVQGKESNEADKKDSKDRDKGNKPRGIRCHLCQEAHKVMDCPWLDEFADFVEAREKTGTVNCNVNEPLELELDPDNYFDGDELAMSGD